MNNIKIKYFEVMLGIIFSLSGFSSVIYQVIWQRSLFAHFGVNLEAVTVIVSVFMAGLGIGSIIGEKICDKLNKNNYALYIFIVIEIFIGIYGFYSLSIIESINIDSNIYDLIGKSYLFLGFPTLLMGSTLPILSKYLTNINKNFSKNINILYGLNTIGAGLAAISITYIIFQYMGKIEAIHFAVFLNLLTAFLVLVLFLFCRKIKFNNFIEDSSNFKNQLIIDITPKKALIFSFFFGFILLSYEIIWFREVSLILKNSPHAFSITLFFMLMGIALGSINNKRVIKKNISLSNLLNDSLLLSGIFFSLMLICFSYLAVALKNIEIPQFLFIEPIILANLFLYFCIFIISYINGRFFPLLTMCAKERVGTIYFFNILGSVSGSLITGFFLFQCFSIYQIILILSIFTVFPLIFSKNSQNNPLSIKLFGYFAIVIAVFLLSNQILERIHTKKMSPNNFSALIEDRHGIIYTYKEDRDTKDTVYGNGVYDGKINIDILHDENFIFRTYATGLFHNNPQNILEIGIAGGAWTKVLSQNKTVKHIDAIDINAGYLKLIDKYSEVRDILTNPKINIIIADGRKWANLHPDKKYDLIVMNTTYSDKAMSTNLLSLEFLKILKTHLNKNGYLVYNATHNPNVLKTAATAFDYVTLVGSFIVASDSITQYSFEQKSIGLYNFMENDEPIFKKSKLHQLAFQKIINLNIDNLRNEYINNKKLYIITDDNMASEFKRNSLN